MHFINTSQMESTALVLWDARMTEMLKKDILHNSVQYISVALVISLYPQHSLHQVVTKQNVVLSQIECIYKVQQTLFKNNLPLRKSKIPQLAQNRIF